MSTESRLSDRLSLSLFVAQLVAAATLIRSIAFDRWITVFASVLLLVGTFAAQRGKTWGVGLSLATAAAFPVASMIGIAPSWFWLVGIAGALPFILASRAFARFDRGATILLAVLALIGGTLGAVGWKEYALDVFRTFPALMPSIEANHTGLLGTVLAATVLMVLRPTCGLSRSRKSSAEEAARARTRVATDSDSAEGIGQLRVASNIDDELDRELKEEAAVGVETNAKKARSTL